MGEPDSQSEEAETQKYFRFVSAGGDYGCQIPVNADHAVIEDSGDNDAAICYNEDDDVSELKDHKSPEEMFGEEYSQYDWYCWVGDYELVEEEVGDDEPADETPVVYATGGNFHLVAERDEDAFEIDGDTLFADESFVLHNGGVYNDGAWPTNGDEPLDVGVFFHELYMTRYGKAMDMIEAKE